MHRPGVALAGWRVRDSMAGEVRECDARVGGHHATSLTRVIADHEVPTPGEAPMDRFPDNELGTRQSSQ